MFEGAENTRRFFHELWGGDGGTTVRLNPDYIPDSSDLTVGEIQKMQEMIANLDKGALTGEQAEFLVALKEQLEVVKATVEIESFAECLDAARAGEATVAAEGDDNLSKITIDGTEAVCFDPNGRDGATVTIHYQGSAQTTENGEFTSRIVLPEGTKVTPVDSGFERQGVLWKAHPDVDYDNLKAAKDGEFGLLLRIEEPGIFGDMSYISLPQLDVNKFSVEERAISEDDKELTLQAQDGAVIEIKVPGV